MCQSTCSIGAWAVTSCSAAVGAHGPLFPRPTVPVRKLTCALTATAVHARMARAAMRKRDIVMDELNEMELCDAEQTAGALAGEVREKDVSQRKSAMNTNSNASSCVYVIQICNDRFERNINSLARAHEKPLRFIF